MTPAAWEQLAECIRTHVPKSLGGTCGELQDLACEASARAGNHRAQGVSPSPPSVDWLA